MDMKRSRKLYYLDPNEYSNIISPVIELTWARCCRITQGRLQIEYEEHNTIGVCLIEDRHCLIDLCKQLNIIPPWISACAGISDALGILNDDPVLIADD
jgi:hypothetical protein